jgi:predicted O-methyltransferase YrrM
MMKVINAKYGAKNTFIDVTDKVKSLLERDGNLIVSNFHFGDPVINVAKQLVIESSMGTLSIPEFDVLSGNGTIYKESDHTMRTPFNCDPTVGREILRLCKYFDIKVAVETGTYHGVTTLFLANHFEKVHTIEIMELNYKISQNRLSQSPNVHLIHGSSDHILQYLLPTLSKGMVLFYLDAHWQDYWPLLDELAVIAQHVKDRCIIVIDDFCVPNRQYDHDFYKNIPNDWNFVKDAVLKCYSQPPVVYYNDFSTRVGTPVGKLYVMPSGFINDDELNSKWVKNENGVLYSRQM